MRLFYFRLKTGRETIPDTEGQELADVAAARRHAVAVAQQIMRHREIGCRNWRIQVCDDYLNPLFEVFFAEADEILGGLSPSSQVTFKNVARSAAALRDAMSEISTTLNDVRAILRRSLLGARF